MNVQILKIEQSFDVESGDVAHYLVLQLPNDAVIQAIVGEEDVQAVVAATVGENVDGEGTVAEQEEPVEEPEVPTLEEERAAALSDNLLEWRKLPDGILDSKVKKVLEEIGIPDQIAEPALAEVVETITTGLAKQAAEQLLKSGPTPAAPEAVAAVPQMKEVPRPRTVPKDEMGNPIVPRATRSAPVVERDPGEVVDEDGVMQL